MSETKKNNADCHRHRSRLKSVGAGETLSVLTGNMGSERNVFSKAAASFILVRAATWSEPQNMAELPRRIFKHHRLFDWVLLSSDSVSMLLKHSATGLMRPIRLDAG